MQVFDISSLQIFTPQELDYLLCGRRELWEVFYPILLLLLVVVKIIEQSIEIIISFIKIVTAG